MIVLRHLPVLCRASVQQLTPWHDRIRTTHLGEREGEGEEEEEEEEERKRKKEETVRKLFFR